MMGRGGDWRSMMADTRTVLPAQASGTALSFRVDGKVRGVVLVGSEVI